MGEVVTRSDCVMKGYWNNPEANARALRDGWLWTGDLGAMDAEGILLAIEGGEDEDDASPEELVGQFREFLDSIKPEDFGS